MAKDIEMESWRTGRSLHIRASSMGSRRQVDPESQGAADRVNRWMEDNNINLETLTGRLRDLGFERDRSTIGRYLNGLRPWPPELKDACSRLLNVSILELCGNSFLSASHGLINMADRGATLSMCEYYDALLARLAPHGCEAGRDTERTIFVR